jgi:acyl carrier protein
MHIKDQLRSFMLREFKESGYHEEIGDNDSLTASNILDSLSILKLIGYLDDQFHVIPDEDEMNADKLSTINKIAELIDKKQAMKK